MSRYLRTKLYKKEKRQIQKDLEDELVEWILMNLSLGIPVTLWEVIINTCSLDERLKLKNVNTLQNLCYRFLKRTCWLSVQVLMLARNYKNHTHN